MQTINQGSIGKGQKWKTIFEWLTSEKYNSHKSWWIEKVYKYSYSDNLLDDKQEFSHYQLRSEEGHKNKIPSKFNEYIKKTFKDERYIINLR